VAHFFFRGIAVAKDIDSSNNKIYAMLNTRYIRIPYETKEDEEKARKMNEEIAHLGVQTYRSATDWAYTPYENALINRSFSERQRRARRPEAEPFKSGDLVRVFKSVTDGDVHWQGKIQYDKKEYHHGIQQGMEMGEWMEMFYDMLPAKITRKRDGKTYFGMLEPFSETGTEGTIWSICEYGKVSYDALHCLEEGDELTVYSMVRDGDVEWEGEVSFGPEQVTKLDWTEIARTTQHMDSKKWLQLSWHRRPAIIVPK
jgi:hypothetical protein